MAERPSEPRVREARFEDLEGVLELYRHLDPNDAPLPPEPAPSTVWREIVDSPRYRCLVVEQGGELVATCFLALHPNLTRGARPYALIENVVTRTDRRRRGLGRAVVRRALEAAWEEGCYKAMLLTGSKRETVHRFYESCGFRGDRKKGFLAKPGE